MKMEGQVTREAQINQEKYALQSRIIAIAKRNVASYVQNKAVALFPATTGADLMTMTRVQDIIVKMYFTMPKLLKISYMELYYIRNVHSKFQSSGEYLVEVPSSFRKFFYLL